VGNMSATKKERNLSPKRMMEILALEGGKKFVKKVIQTYHIGDGSDFRHYSLRNRNVCDLCWYTHFLLLKILNKCHLIRVLVFVFQGCIVGISLQKFFKCLLLAAIFT